MLKVNYTDCGPYLEQLTTSWDVIAAQQVTLAIRVGDPLYLESSRATLLLSVESPGISQLKRLLRKDSADVVRVMAADEEFIEVTLKGVWIAGNASTDSGVFITMLSPESEQLIYQLWQINHFR